MVQDTSNLAKQGADVLGAVRNLDIEELLDSKSKALLVGHHGDVVETVKVRESLEIGLVLDQLFRATVQETDVGISANNLLAVDLKNQTQHTVGSGMLGTKVDGVVSDLAALGRVLVERLFHLAVTAGAGEAIVVGKGAEVIIDGDESGADGLGGRVLAGTCCREGSGGGQGLTKTQPSGARAGESVEGAHGKSDAAPVGSQLAREGEMS